MRRNSHILRAKARLDAINRDLASKGALTIPEARQLMGLAPIDLESMHAEFTRLQTGGPKRVWPWTFWLERRKCSKPV